MLRDMLGDYDSLPDTYTLADYSDAASGFDVRGVAWSDAGAADPVAAAEWVTSQNTAGRVIGLVALGDPTDRGFEQLLSGLRANVLVTSVRVRLVPAFQTGAPAAPSDADGRLTDLARHFPRLPVVLDHFGWPDDLSDAGRGVAATGGRRTECGNPHRCDRHDLRRVGHGHTPAVAAERRRGVRGGSLHARLRPPDRDAAVQLWRLVRRVRPHLRLISRGRPAAAVQRHGATALRRRHASVKQLAGAARPREQ